MNKQIVAVSIFVIAFSSVCMAEDLSNSTDPSIGRDVFDWSGPYIGAVTGYERGNGDNHFPRSPTAEADAKFSGGTFGFYGGYNWRLGNAIYGVDAEITSSTVDGSGKNWANETITTELGLTALMRARVGYAFDGFLIYGTGGLATTKASLEGLGSGFGVFADVDDRLTGWTLGAGAEYAFTDKLLGRFEYRHSDYGSIAYQASGGPGSVDVKMNSLTLGVSVKF